MFKSIRVTLLFWYALILLVVIGAFGAILYFEMRQSIINEVDAELRAHAQGLGGMIESYQGGGYNVELPEDNYFRNTGGEAPYFAIWTPKRQEIVSSDPSLKIPPPEGPVQRDREEKREVVVQGNCGCLVLVGRGIHQKWGELSEFLGMVLGAGGSVLVLALLGGWFLVGRALAPVRRISQTATAISGSNLSQRIDVQQTESELGRLAKTLNEAFDRLEAAFDRQTRFTADASHELRTPLSIVMSHLELALRKERSAEEYREAMETSFKASQRMRAVVEGLLTLARADAGELQIQKEEVEFGMVVQETAAMLRPLAEQKKVELKVQADEVKIRGDRDRIREVVTNLVTNAIRYNREGGRVEVSVRSNGHDAVLTVADTGVGIPEKDRAHIFERFYRVDKARSREMGGSGLGLAITRWVVEAHGGSISFESREGEGTTFTVRLAKS